MGCVIFSSFPDDDSGQQSRDHRKAELPPISETEEVEHPESDYGDERRGKIRTYAQGFQKLLKTSAFFSADSIYSYN